MADHTTTASGKITHVFGHRFVVQTSKGAVLADLTPKGAGLIDLQVGDDVSLSGETKPTEIKVTELTRAGDKITVPHDKKGPHDHSHADPREAIEAARKAGYDVLGEPRRKPKHFEVLGRKDKHFSELHIELNGHIRKDKPVKADEVKWAEELRAAS